MMSNWKRGLILEAKKQKPALVKTHNDFVVGKIPNIQDADRSLRERLAEQIAKDHVPDSTRVSAPVTDKEAIWRGILKMHGANVWGKKSPEYSQQKEEIKQQFLSGAIDVTQAEEMLKQAASSNTDQVDAKREEQRAERARLFNQVMSRTPFQFKKYPEDLRQELQKRLEGIRNSVTTFVMQPDELYNAIPFLLNWVEGEMKKRFGEQPPEIPQQKQKVPVQQPPVQQAPVKRGFNFDDEQPAPQPVKQVPVQQAVAKRSFNFDDEQPVKQTPPKRNFNFEERRVI
jgi:hypothetical protein